jgi:hypothetical protein
MKKDPDPYRLYKRVPERSVLKEPAWIVTKVDGKIASVSTDYRHFAYIAEQVAKLPPKSVGAVVTAKLSTEEVVGLAEHAKWDDLRLFGSPFQLKVWKSLYDLDHSAEDGSLIHTKLYSYSEFSEICGNPLGVRPVAHAVAMNPVAYIIPCHLIVPKEAIDKIAEIRAKAQDTLFKGRDLYLLDTIDGGEYAYGSALKRRFIAAQFANSQLG